MGQGRSADKVPQITSWIRDSLPRSRSFARLDTPRTDEETTFAVVSDPHVTPSHRGTWKVFHRTEERLETAIDDINRRDVDAVLLAGDITKDGVVGEFHRVDEILDELSPPFVAIPGNHDVPKPALDSHATPPLDAFVHQYAGGELPFVERIGGVDLVGLNSAAADGSLAGSHRGRVSTSQLRWLSETLHILECPVVAVHHNLARHRSDGVPREDDIYQLDNADEVAAILAEAGAELVLSGHIHYPAVGTLRGVREVVLPAVCSFPQAYALVRIGPSGTEIELIPLADWDGLCEARELAIRDDRERSLPPSAEAFPLVDERAPRTGSDPSTAPQTRSSPE